MFLYAKVGRFFIGLWSTQVFLTATAVSKMKSGSVEKMVWLGFPDPKNVGNESPDIKIH